MNALEKIVDLLAAVCILFLIPLLYYGSGKRIAQTMLAEQASEAFLNQISTAGEITLPVWTEFEHAVEQFGCETIEILRERRLFEPIGEGVAERVYTEASTDLLTKIDAEGTCYLQKDDRIKLTLYINEVPFVFYETVRTGATGR